MKIEPIEIGHPIELGKRAHLPFVVTSRCPKCNVEVSRYLNNDYLSYPVVGQNAINFYHQDADDNDSACSNEWKELVILGFTLTAVDL